MSTSKSDTSGIFHPLTVESAETSLSLASHAVRVRKSGIEFQCGKPIPAWTEMTVDLHSPRDGKRVQCTGVVVACQGNRHAGYTVSMVFVNLSPQARENLSLLAFA
ncbi:MAG: PilZ domain-containing protein [Pedosphaera parvula]|nr:PilZ domain-containing protein [Pedosphaera parvula]